MAGNPKDSKWYSTPPGKRKAKPSIFTLTPAEQTTLDALASEHDAPRSRVVGAAILALAVHRSAGTLIVESVERVRE